ncbi:NAD-binding protein [Fomitopsis schrenkii]|uniref:NAD-binding protein n=1 Tax=Fomitopsis schrenkii TaxID=2126942 RepID=S8DYC9_FOMSC|nr:NAD-binding protein [Fomitopsis schrenkii]
MASISTWFITGAPRGLGLELVRQLVAALNNFAIAAVRNPDTATQLKALKPAAGSELHLVQLDVSDEASIRASVGKAEAVLAGRGLDYLWNNAGIVRRARRRVQLLVRAVPDRAADERRRAPPLLASLFLPLLEKGTKETIVNVSSSMGSLTEDHADRMETYCVSKAALNMVTHKQVKKPPDITSISLSPGWVKTDLGGPFAPLETKDSVAGLLKVVLGLKKEDTGKFLSYDGKKATW